MTEIAARSEWRRLDRGPKHGIINDSFGVHEEEMNMFEMNCTKVWLLLFYLWLISQQIMTQTSNESKQGNSFTDRQEPEVIFLL